MLVHISGALNGSNLITTSTPNPSGYMESGNTASTVQNIAFGVITTTIAIASVAIACLHYRHTRRTTIDLEASQPNTGVEFNTTEGSNGLEAREQVEVRDMQLGDVEVANWLNMFRYCRLRHHYLSVQHNLYFLFMQSECTPLFLATILAQLAW
jgi:hypothetical protein